MGISLPTAIILLLAGVFLLFLEMFIPSAGLLFICASCCVVGSLIIAFIIDIKLGGVFLFIVLVLAVTLPGILFQIWKRTPIGRRMFLNVPPADADAAEDSVDAGYRSLMGEVGKTLTPLRPAGTTEFSGRRVDTVAEGILIEPGSWVKVVDVQGRRVVVRQIEAIEADPPRRPANTNPEFELS